MVLANSGTFTYNGVAWLSLYRTKVEVKPVKDSAGRALVAREYALDVEGYVAAVPGSTTDATLASLRRLLEQPGGALAFSAKGFGALQVNLPGGQLWDMAYGPWPEVLAWDPVGNDQGCFVRWRCTTQVPCEENPTPRGIVEMCWEEAWDVDDDGYTTRTIEGHLVVEATRANVASRAIPDNADAYRDRVVPDLPTGFRRTQSYHLSEDKRTLDFRIVDSQLPAPLPDGVTHAEVKHKVRWNPWAPGAKEILVSTISGTIVLPAGVPKVNAWAVIMLVLRSRWPIGGRTIGVKVGPGSGAAGVGALAGQAAGAVVQGLLGGSAAPSSPVTLNASFIYLLTQVELEDDVFGRGTTFSACAVILPKGYKGDAAKIFLSPQILVSACGLWEPIANTSFVTWKGSVFQRSGAGKPYAPRGQAAMSFQNSDDLIVDLCARAVPPTPSSLTGSNYANSMRSSLPPGSNSTLPPDDTWLKYRCSIRQVEDDRVARHKPLSGTVARTPAPVLQGSIASVQTRTLTTGGVGGASLAGGGGQGSSLSGGSLAGSTQGQDAGVTSNSPDLLQAVGSPTYTILLEGSAVRVGYAIPTPRVRSVAGQQVTQLWQDVAQEEVGVIGGQTIYAAWWRIAYAMPASPQGALPLAANPALE